MYCIVFGRESVVVRFYIIWDYLCMVELKKKTFCNGIDATRCLPFFKLILHLKTVLIVRSLIHARPIDVVLIVRCYADTRFPVSFFLQVWRYRLRLRCGLESALKILRYYMSGIDYTPKT